MVAAESFHEIGHFDFGASYLDVLSMSLMAGTGRQAGCC